jgi:hypothetical protein
VVSTVPVTRRSRRVRLPLDGPAAVMRLLPADRYSFRVLSVGLPLVEARVTAVEPSRLRVLLAVEA